MKQVTITATPWFLKIRDANIVECRFEIPATGMIQALSFARYAGVGDMLNVSFDDGKKVIAEVHNFKMAKDKAVVDLIMPLSTLMFLAERIKAQTVTITFDE